MTRLYFIGMDVLCAAVFVVPIALLLNVTLLKRHGFRWKALFLMLGLYLAAVFSAVGLPDAASLTVEFRINAIPLIDIVSDPAGYVKNTVLNILLFLPLGFLLPFLWKRFESAKTIFLTGLLFSAGIEFLQIFTWRLTDVDDLITNSLGALLGYLLFRIVPGKRKGRISETSAASVDPGHHIASERFEFPVLLTVVFLGMFFLQPIVFNTAWEWILADIL